MAHAMYINAKGERVYPYEVFKALDPDKARGLPTKAYKSRRQRRIDNGKVKA